MSETRMRESRRVTVHFAIRCSILCAALQLASAPLYGEENAQRVDFAQSIQPLFETHCYDCHAEGSREGGIYLDDSTGAFAASDSGRRAIVPGRSAESGLLRSLLEDDPDHRMPQDAEPLSTDEIELIRNWIDQGATWPAGKTGQIHWAYIPPVKTELPAAKYAWWTDNPIDLFVADRFEEQGLTPSQPAEKEVLLRRLTLALTGLPPTLEQLDRFLADDSSEAYERQVDRLLASQRYGERWAVDWLDLARYADSNGYQADQLRESWAYRDWVIQALNNDMPFDQFVIEQLAGDLLPGATDAQRIATGFHRTVTCNVEAGVHPEENRVNQVFDRVNTTGTVFLGTTIECCQCHSHKYDPFSQQEYYQLFAYFNNTPVEVEGKGGVSFDFIGPTMDLPLAPSAAAKRAALQSEQRSLKAQREKLVDPDSESRTKWQAAMRQAIKSPPTFHALQPTRFSTSGDETFEVLEDRSVLISGDVPNTSTYVWESTGQPLEAITGFRIEAIDDDSLPGRGPGRGDAARPNFILSELNISLVEQGGQQAIRLHSPHADYSQKGWEVGKAFDGDLKTGWAIGQKFGVAHSATFITDHPIDLLDGDSLRFTLAQNYGNGRTIGRLRISAMVGDPLAHALPAEMIQIFSAKNWTKQQEKKVDEYYAQAHPAVQQIDREMARLQSRLDQVKPSTTLVMVEMEEPRETHFLIRGNYLIPGPEVTHGTPTALHPLDPDLPQNRLGFARWLVDKRNPLLARVTVNRWWASFFGRGIVDSPEDFGTASEPPSHPDLLDWLAVEFMEQGWSPKHIHKMIVMSSTFQQTSNLDEHRLRIDPLNRWLARGPRLRMSAETVRDNALAVSGLLSLKMGGTPVMPHQPAGIWRQVGRNEPKWVDAFDEDRFRRGVYVVWRRAAPYPSFVNFDAPDRASCVVARSRTNTPLQALTLMNDPAYVEIALALADRICNEIPDSTVAEQARIAFRLCVARSPKPEELRELVDLFHAELKRMQADPSTAQTLIGGIEGYRPKSTVAPSRLAAWFHVANVLLNLDETITNG